MKNSYCYIFFFLLFSCFLGHSQAKEYLFKTISTENGLSNNIIYDILQDSYGYVWIATDNGLNRYDGYTSKKFFHKAEDSLSISSSVVRSLLEDHDGNIWAGTRSGLNLYNRETQSFSQPIKHHSSAFSNQGVQKMLLGNDGRIWMNILSSVGVLDLKNSSFKSIYNSENSLHIGIALANEKVWILNKSGQLNYYDIKADKLVSLLKDSSLENKAVYFGKHSQKLWLPDYLQLTMRNKNYNYLPKLPNNLNPNNFLEVDSMTLWIGTNKGLFEYDIGLKKLRKISLNASTLAEQIRCIYEDKFGGIWIGTLGGVFHYDAHRKVFRHHNIVEGADDIVMGLHAAKSGIYANALGQGVYYKAEDSIKFKKLELPSAFPSQGLFIWDIEEVPENPFPIWMSTNEGVLCLNPITASYQKLAFKQLRTNKDEHISFSILNTENDYLWLSTHNAIHKIRKVDGKLLSSFSLNDLVQYSGIQKIISLGAYLFIATEREGLFAFHLKSHKISKVTLDSNPTKKELLKTPIWDLHASEFTLWIGTNKGLYSLSLKDLVVKPVLEDDQIIFSIVQDDSGVLWMGSDKGIKTYNPSSQMVRFYNTNNGLKNKEFNRKSAIKTANGHLWFGGVNGITSFNPDKINKDNPNTPFVHVTNLQVVTSDSTFKIPHFQKKIVLPWSHNTIEIEFIGLNYTNSLQNKYQYQMEGYDPDWVHSKVPNNARYVRLPVGSYKFNVIAANNDNIWNTVGDYIEIRIKPPIWRTNMAYFIYFLVLLRVISLFRRLKKYRMRVKVVELEKDLIAKKVEEKFIVLNNKTKVYLKELKYIKAAGNYLEFYTEDKTIIDRNKLKIVSEKLPPNFIRTHRSYIVNKNYILSANSASVIIKPNIETPLSRTFKGSLS